MKEKKFEYTIDIQEINDNVYFMEFGNGCRIEAKNSALNIDKIALNLQSFDKKTNREICHVPFYLNVNDALVLANDILSGRLVKIASALEKKGESIPVVFEITGGVPASRAKRDDGKPLFRSFRISKGKKWIVTASHGPGKTTDTGGFVADGPAEASVRVGLSDNSMKAFALKTQMEVSSYRTSKMLLSALKPVLVNLENSIKDITIISEQPEAAPVLDEEELTAVKKEEEIIKADEIDIDNIDLSEFM